MCPGADSASKNEYQDIPGSKDGRCVRLTTYHLHVPNVKKIRGLNLPDPHGPVQACSGTVSVFYHTSSLIGPIPVLEMGKPHNERRKNVVLCISVSVFLPDWKTSDLDRITGGILESNELFVC